MNEQQLQYFLEIYNCKNLRVAADNLYISRQALSKALHSLETELNKQLFIRKSTGVCPTEAAELLKPRAEKIIAEFRQIHDDITLHELNENVLTIYTFDCVMSYISLDFIRWFKKQHPGILLNIVNTTDSVCEKYLQENRCDCAIMPSSVNLSPYHVTELFTSHFCVAMNRTHPFAQKEYITETDLHQTIMIGKGRSIASYFQELNYLLKAGIRPQIQFETTDSLMLFQATEENQGIAFVWDYMSCNCQNNSIIFKPYKEKENREKGIFYLVSSRKNKSDKKSHYISLFRTALLKWIENNNLKDTRNVLPFYLDIST